MGQRHHQEALIHKQIYSSRVTETHLEVNISIQNYQNISKSYHSAVTDVPFSPGNAGKALTEAPPGSRPLALPCWFVSDSERRGALVRCASSFTDHASNNSTIMFDIIRSELPPMLQCLFRVFSFCQGNHGHPGVCDPSELGPLGPNQIRSLRKFPRFGKRTRESMETRRGRKVTYPNTRCVWYMMV